MIQWYESNEDTALCDTSLPTLANGVSNSEAGVKYLFLLNIFNLLQKLTCCAGNVDNDPSIFHQYGIKNIIHLFMWYKCFEMHCIY